MKSIFVIVLGAVALQCAAQSSERAPVTDARLLMLAALRSPDGQAHGLLTGDIAQAGCSRLRLSFWQDGVLLPGAKAPRKQSIEFGINYCLDGMPPKSLS